MATVLDFGLLAYLAPLFVFFFVFVLLYALFTKFKILGEDKSIHSLVAFILAIIFVLVADLRNLLTIIVPIFVLFFIVIIIIFIGVMLLGMSQEDITKYIKGTPSITITAIVITLVIFVFGVATVFPEVVGYPSSTQSGFGIATRRLIFNPKVLGAVFILVVASYVIKAVGYKK